MNLSANSSAVPGRIPKDGGVADGARAISVSISSSNNRHIMADDAVNDCRSGSVANSSPIIFRLIAGYSAVFNEKVSIVIEINGPAIIGTVVVNKSAIQILMSLNKKLIAPPLPPR